MYFNYLGFVNQILAMTKQSSVTDVTTTIGTDAYNVQACVNRVIADLSNILRIKKRSVNFTITTVAGQNVYSVPRRVIYPFKDLRQKNTPLIITQMSPEDFDRLVPDDQSSGPAEKYYLDGYSGVETQPAAAGEVVYLVSSDSDAGAIVVQGYDVNGNYIQDSLTLNGATPIQTTNAYQFIESISKGVTNGAITARNLGATTTFLILNPKDTHTRIMRMGLYPIPNSVTTIYGRSYLQTPNLVNNLDVPIGFDESHINAIIKGAYAQFIRYDTTLRKISSQQADQAYMTEVRKIIAMNTRDSNMLNRMKSAAERPVVSYFRPLDQYTPY